MITPHPPLPKFLDTLESRPRLYLPNHVVRTLGQHAQLFPEHDSLTPEQRELLGRALLALRRVVAEHGASDESMVNELAMLGKLGRFDEAVGRARAAYDERPNWSSAIALGNALRRAGDLRDAVAMFATAANLDVEDVTALLEVGDIELEAGRFAEALAAYEAALGREDRQPWAEVSAWYCRYRTTGDKQWLTKLKRAASKTPHACGLIGASSSGYSDEDRRARAADLLRMLEE
jgi:tetratricopeptide (TPR) repeat protein